MHLGDTAEFIGGKPTMWTRCCNIGTLLLISFGAFSIIGSALLGAIWVTGLHTKDTVISILVVSTSLWFISSAIESWKQYDSMGNFLLQLSAGALIFGSSMSLWFTDDVQTMWYYVSTTICILNTFTLSRWIHQLVN